MSRRSVWQKVYERFDPEHPAQVRSWRADRPLSPADEIERSLDMPFGDPRILLRGTVGTGKTTELLRIAEARAAKDFVVLLDLERHFSEVVGDAPALQRISSWEVCFLAAMALIRAASDRLAYDFPETHLQELQGAWASIAKATDTSPTPPQIELGALAKSMIVLASAATPLAAPVSVAAGVGVGLKSLEAMTGALKWALPMGVGKRSLPDQNSEMRTLLGCVNVLIGLVRQRGSRMLLVLDGLDRIRELDRAKALFVESQMIAQLACPIVVSGPFALRHDPAITAVRRFTKNFVLHNEPVLLQGDPKQHGPGVRFLCELFNRRVDDLRASDLVPPVLLERLAYYSGGRARDFVRFIRELAELAWQADALSATEEMTKKVLDTQRHLQETGIHTGHIELLERIAADPEHRLPDGDLAEELLTYGMLLPYPNESEWYYPHPLLTMHLVKVGKTAPKAPRSA